MKHTPSTSNQRLKLILLGVGMAVLGVLLIFLYLLVRPPSESTAGPAGAATPTTLPTTLPSSQPATAPASAPATPPTHQRPPIDPRAAGARNMSAMLLLFALMAFTVTGVCALLLVIDIRKSRPAWKTQTKYPRRR